MNRLELSTMLTALLMLPGTLLSSESGTIERWELQEAQRASSSVATREHRDQLERYLRAGDSQAALGLIREIESQEDWPVPARERVIHDFVSSLRREPPRTADEQLMNYLTGYRSLVFVPHEDHPQSMVPMFNIRATASGVVNDWSRREAAYEGAVHLASGVDAFVQAYAAEESEARRHGLVDALSSASTEQLQALSRWSLAVENPGAHILELAATAVTRSKDFESLIPLLARATGPVVAALLRQSAGWLDIEQSSRLLRSLLENAPVETGALAISLLTPVLSGHQPTENLLIRMLPDPVLGSSAALALARNPSREAIRKLSALAKPGHATPGASRAKLALELTDSQSDPKARP